MRLKVLGSSSHGNCYLLETSDGVLIIECGVNFNEVKQALNFDFSNVIGCLVSHEHKDHCKYINEVIKRGITVYASCGTFGSLNIESHRIAVLFDKITFNISDHVMVLPFATQHDAAEPLGFLILDTITNEKLLFATDTYYVRYKFIDINYMLVECNYSNELLEVNPNAQVIADRLKTSHFELNNVKEFLKASDLRLCRNIVLLHLSNDNSNAKQFQKEIQELTKIETCIAEKGLVLELNKTPF